MQKFVARSFFFLVLTGLYFNAFAQGFVQMDAIAFARDSGKTQVEMYYTVAQGAMPFVEKPDGWHVTINARAELWENGHVLAASTIKKEKLVKGSRAAFDSSKRDLILDGVALTAAVKTGGEAALIFLFNNEKGKETADTITRSFLAPITSKDKYVMGGIEFATSLKATSDRSNPFEKVGFVITPNPSKLFGVGNTKLNYYSELNTPAPVTLSDCEIITRVLSGDKHLMFSNTHRQALLAPVTPIIGSIDIDGLPSDSYILQLEVKSGTLFDALAEKQFFFDDGMNVSEESNESVNKQALDEENIYAVSGIANMAEMEVLEKGNQAMYIAKTDQQKTWKQLKEKSEVSSENSPEKQKNIAEERKFLYAFWREKDIEKGSRMPLSAFHEYYRLVDEANKKFTIMKTPGWETDFGRIYLKYGAPEERNIDKQLHSINAKPYISWTYFDKNIKLFTGNHPLFIFVDRRGGGKFELVHSNALGETYEPDWYSREVQVR